VVEIYLYSRFKNMIGRLSQEDKDKISRIAKQVVFLYRGDMKNESTKSKHSSSKQKVRK